MVEFSIKQVAKKIWHLNFSDSYDLTIHFFRYQEYYESPDMKKKNVQFVDLMENYSRTIGKGSFTYTKDWAGFNMPGDQIFERHRAGISDPNRHDELMYSLACYIRSKEKSEKFYIIGTSNDDDWRNTTFNHELAHGLFYADEAYKARMTKYVEELPERVRSKIFGALKKWGYDEKFFVDECQAYMATGLQEGIDAKMIVEHQSRFKRLFNSYSKGIRKRPDRGYQANSAKAAAKKTTTKKKVKKTTPSTSKKPQKPTKKTTSK